MHDDDIEDDQEEDEKPNLEDGQEVKDEQMDLDSDGEMDDNAKSSPATSPKRTSRAKLRFPSPDFSWLPPIPDLTIQQPEPNSPSATTRPRHAVESIAVPSAIVDRYRTRIPFASSSLTTQTTYNTPQNPPNKRLPSGTTSLTDLISTYADTKGEMSVSIRPNGYRLQALDLLRRQIAAPEGYSPHDSLVIKGSVAGPRFTPIAVPPRPVAVNPAQDGILSRLLHSIQSANLPSELRERLTTLRPPLAQKRDGQPITYGPGLRGADDAALARAQGKEALKEDEVYSYATWDSGPRGLEKFNRPNLPRGKKVIRYVEGEDIPRQEKRKASQPPPGDVGPSGGLGRTLKIRLGDSVSPAPPAISPIPSPGLNLTGTASTTPPVNTPGGTTLRLKIKRDSLDIPTPPTETTNGIMTGPPRHSPRNAPSPLPITTSQIGTNGSGPSVARNSPSQLTAPLPAQRDSPSQSSLPLPLNDGPTTRHSPRNFSSTLPQTQNSPRDEISPLPPTNGDTGPPPRSLQNSNSPAPNSSLSPHTTGLPLPHRSTRHSVSPLNPNIPLPDIKPTLVDSTWDSSPKEQNGSATDTDKNGPVLHGENREKTTESAPSNLPTLSPTLDNAALPKDRTLD